MSVPANATSTVVPALPPHGVSTLRRGWGHWLPLISWASVRQVHASAARPKAITNNGRTLPVKNRRRRMEFSSIGTRRNKQAGGSGRQVGGRGGWVLGAGRALFAG